MPHTHYRPGRKPVSESVSPIAETHSADGSRRSAALAGLALLAGVVALISGACVSVQKEAELPQSWRAALRPVAGTPVDVSGIYSDTGESPPAPGQATGQPAYLRHALLPRAESASARREFELRQLDEKRLEVIARGGAVASRILDISLNRATGEVSIARRTEGERGGETPGALATTTSIVLIRGRDRHLYVRERVGGVGLLGPLPVAGISQRWSRFPPAAP